MISTIWVVVEIPPPASVFINWLSSSVGLQLITTIDPVIAVAVEHEDRRNLHGSLSKANLPTGAPGAKAAGDGNPRDRALHHHAVWNRIVAIVVYAVDPQFVTAPVPYVEGDHLQWPGVALCDLDRASIRRWIGARIVRGADTTT